MRFLELIQRQQVLDLLSKTPVFLLPGQHFLGRPGRLSRKEFVETLVK
jgi:hypothetical protein